MSGYWALMRRYCCIMGVWPENEADASFGFIALNYTGASRRASRPSCGRRGQHASADPPVLIVPQACRRAGAPFAAAPQHTRNRHERPATDDCGTNEARRVSSGVPERTCPALLLGVVPHPTPISHACQGKAAAGLRPWLFLAGCL